MYVCVCVCLYTRVYPPAPPVPPAEAAPEPRGCCGARRGPAGAAPPGEERGRGRLEKRGRARLQVSLSPAASR